MELGIRLDRSQRRLTTSGGTGSQGWNPTSDLSSGMGGQGWTPSSFDHDQENGSPGMARLQSRAQFWHLQPF
ncbi:hypothetical protein GN244_ATG19138 [Phytophthora infestans]|uniref:Uncharacterized protein n=1 Tax=Phytophthora infestans TaxID=4787 RepID=A0A833SEB7_PHYIN|nr:hypothetical protein GN244_ATG19494 [Phytophthora infestans]KAF4028809.1 hypothetical protein GN244_ATG19497 [Phytophthora infestans]KAF4029152.1 hypothetical protein GN244_ATG19138 [Phytophthora infestans]KAF4142762.1 hypothetical protein GN958_ATG08074 [Phytophthora infestans]